MNVRRPILGRFLVLGCLVLSLLTGAAVAGADGSVELVYGDPDSMTALRISATGDEATALPEKTPLGSVWKLFVYVYLGVTEIETDDYRCTGGNLSEEAYCCAAGERIGRDEALAKSCGLYFSPERLGLTSQAWREFWQKEAPLAPDWLYDLEKMRPSTEVSVASLLAALDAIHGDARQIAWQGAQRVTLQPSTRPLLSHLGNVLRIKTWSWHEEPSKERIGGFAGWLTDGTPVWLRGKGTSKTVIETAAPWLVGRLPAQHVLPENACVKVRFFMRYPLAEVLLDDKSAEEGPLRGKVEVRFVNGQQLAFTSAGDIFLARDANHPLLTGRFGLDDYIARVVEREAGAEPPAAARALAVAARTYLVRHAGFGGGCYEIDDDSRAQRVSPRQPQRAVLDVALWSNDLILQGVDGRYHSYTEAPERLSWSGAVARANDGSRWDEILTDVYGNTGFGLVGQGDVGECQRLKAAEIWLAGRERAWKAKLAGLPGYEAPSPLPVVCRLDHGNPYADLERGRIYAIGINSVNDRLTLTHEYLHFALRFHPRGLDEEFIETTSRALLGL